MQACHTMRAFTATRPSARSCVRVAATAAPSSAAPRQRPNLASIMSGLQQNAMKTDLKKVVVGDTVRIGLTVSEGKGKTRTQSLEGTIIGEQGTGINKTVTFRRIFQGFGMELTLPVHAPVLQSMEVVKHGRVRRSKLYYLRQRIGKAAKLKEIVGAAAVKMAKAESKAAAAATAAAPAAAAAAQ